jgi:hypothetical protein
MSLQFQMASAITALGGYGSGGSSDDDESDDGRAPRSPQPGPIVPPSVAEPLPEPGARLTSSTLCTAIVSAPVVELNAALDTRRHLDPSATEVKYNPR